MTITEQLKQIKRSRLSEVDLYLINLLENAKCISEIIDENRYIENYFISETKSYESFIQIEHINKKIYYNTSIEMFINYNFNIDYKEIENKIIENIKNFFNKYNYEIHKRTMI